jgi:hypothetical protein
MAREKKEGLSSFSQKDRRMIERERDEKSCGGVYVAAVLAK